MPNLLSLLLLILSLFHPLSFVHASDYQQCTTSSTCTIGEFLYDDDYSPLVGASCSLTVKYPDNSSFLNSASMSSGADGWYSYDLTLGTTEGMYHSNICCTPASGTLCIDKTFEVKAPSGNSLTPSGVIPIELSLATVAWSQTSGRILVAHLPHLAHSSAISGVTPVEPWLVLAR